jgi:hypothetical protein
VNKLKSKITGMILCLALLFSAFAAAVMPAPAVANGGAGTTSLTVTKYAADGTTVLAQQTVDYNWMQSNLPVRGDGSTIYRHERSTPGQWRVKGAVQGTDVKDLCDLVGGASSGDIIQIQASDLFSRSLPYDNIYNPAAGQGKYVICWYTKNYYDGTQYPSGAYVPTFTDGMISVFLADDHDFSNADMNTYIPAPYRPSSADGLSVKNVAYVNIFSQLWRITATAGAHGSIDPSGDVLVSDGANQTFTITPDAGCWVDDVLVDGNSVGAVTSYTFANVTAHHTIDASFVIAPTAGPRSSPSIPAAPRSLNPPQMSVQYVSVNPQQTTANQPVTITTNVVNTGDEAGNINIALTINGQLEQSRMVSVGPQGTQPVKFTVTKAQPGTYNVNILDKSGSFTILGASSSTSTSSGNSGLIILLIIGVLVVATVMVLMLSRRRA